jgi:hypothetical protein
MMLSRNLPRYGWAGTESPTEPAGDVDGNLSHVISLPCALNLSESFDYSVTGPVLRLQFSCKGREAAALTHVTAVSFRLRGVLVVLQDGSLALDDPEDFLAFDLQRRRGAEFAQQRDRVRMRKRHADS